MGISGYALSAADDLFLVSFKCRFSSPGSPAIAAEYSLRWLCYDDSKCQQHYAIYELDFSTIRIRSRLKSFLAILFSGAFTRGDVHFCWQRPSDVDAEYANLVRFGTTAQLFDSTLNVCTITPFRWVCILARPTQNKTGGDFWPHRSWSH